METQKFTKGKHFEEKIVQALITDHQFAEQMLEVVDVEYFNVEHLKEVSKQIFDYYDQYTAFPSFKTLAVIVKDKIDNKILQQQVMQYLVKLKSDPLNGDAEYIKEESLDFCRKRSLAIALEKSLGHIEQKSYDEIVPEIQKALVAGSERDVGHVFASDEAFELRMSEEHRKTVPTPWPEINNLLQGGIGPGELLTLAAFSSRGKSHFLVDWAHYVAKMGYNVVYYTLELSDTMVGKRFDSRFSSIPVQNLIQHKDLVRKSLEDVKGTLVIKNYPAKGATSQTFKSHIHKLAMKDMRPDIVFVDMGELMCSRKSHDGKRFEEDAIWLDLRNLAGVEKLPVITVTQTNRESESAEVIMPVHVAECIQKFHHSDVFIGMQRTPGDAEWTIGNFYFGKNRFGPDGIRVPIMMNTAISKIRIANEEEIQEITVDPQERLREAFKEFKKK